MWLGYPHGSRRTINIKLMLLRLCYRFVPLAIDLATLAGMLYLVPWLGARFFVQSSVGHFFLIPGFFLIVVGIVAVRSLPKSSLDDRKAPSILAICLVFFQVLTYSILYIYATNPGGTAQENESAGVWIFFVFLLPVIGAFSWPTTNAKPKTTRALVAGSISLVCVNYLTLIGASVWHHFSSLPTPNEPVYATGISFVILFGVLYLLFLVFFGLPRIYLLRATGDKFGLTAYLVGLAVFLWNQVPPVN
jgi:hypothetical protein